MLGFGLTLRVRVRVMDKVRVGLGLGLEGNCNANVRIEVTFPAHVSIYRVTIPALFGHHLIGRTLTVTVKTTIYRKE